VNRNSERKYLRAKVAELENELAHKRIEVANLKIALAKQDATVELVRKVVGNSANLFGGGGGGGLQMRVGTGSDV
jgi:hypothetical protein